MLAGPKRRSRSLRPKILVCLQDVHSQFHSQFRRVAEFQNVDQGFSDLMMFNDTGVEDTEKDFETGGMARQEIVTILDDACTEDSMQQFVNEI